VASYCRGEEALLSHLYGNKPSKNASSASSEFPLKDGIRGKRFEDDGEVISEVKRWLRQRPAEWYCKGTQALASRWRKAKDLEGDMLKNSFR
jgi:hypothetical protein